MAAETETCLYCEEPIRFGEAIQVMADGQRLHHECLTRMVVGSVGHQLGRCGCRGGCEEDPPGMTRREAALAALAQFRESQALRN